MSFEGWADPGFDQELRKFRAQEVMLVTTVFHQKRDEDDKAALVRHEKRLLPQVPPGSAYLQDLGF